MATRTYKTLPSRCNTCGSDVYYCNCPSTWDVENIVPREQRLHIRFPENATIGTRFDACQLPIEIFLLFSPFMSPITLLTMMQALYPWIMPSSIMSHLRHNAKRTYQRMHTFLVGLEFGATIQFYGMPEGHGPLPSCFAFTCNNIVFNPNKRGCEHTCQCGITYYIDWIRRSYSGSLGPVAPIMLHFTRNEAADLDAFTETFDVWAGSRSYAPTYTDAQYDEIMYEAELEAKADTAHLIKARVKTNNKSHDREKKHTRAHKNARCSRIKRHCKKGRNTPKSRRDLSVI